MKTRLLIIIGMLSVGFSGITFAEQPINCTFGDKSTPLENIFEKDLAVKAFTEKHQNATRSIAANESDSLKKQLVLQAQNDNIKETLEIKFNTDTKGCHIPASYHYSYDDGIIDVTIRNSVANFTEIMNLIKSNNKSIDDFYPDDCDFVDLDVTITSGKVFGACKGTISKFITLLIDAPSDGILEVDIPIQMVYSLPSTDCKPTGDFLVMSDDEETRYEIMPIDIGNLVKVEFAEGFHKIWIMGTVILPDPSPVQYCGIVEGYEKQFLAPLVQTNRGVKAEFIRCNVGLVLTQRIDDSPVCVKPQTLQKLRERGWAEPLGDIVFQRPSQTTSEWNAMKLVHNNDDIYCNSTNEELSGQCYSLDEIVFGDGNKRKDQGWRLYPGGASWIPPENSTLMYIHKDVEFGVPPLDFTAMLDDKIFVNKCESNGGIWNYTLHDCEGLWQVCRDVGGIMIQEDITPPCTDTGVINDDPLTIKVCNSAGIIRVSCVFEYEN